MKSCPVVLISLTLALASCGGAHTSPSDEGTADEPVGQSTPAGNDNTETGDSTETDDSTETTEPADTSADDNTDGSDTEDPEVEPEPEEPEIDPACDVDGDGYLNYDCGGDDCDDENAFNHPGQVRSAISRTITV